ncbi:hypothetical protein [Microbacterium sp. CFBP9034]|uniref:hypothetical protein n=1 Tax=Microbacterium sp. CFBP9034 TaxID=3096540 RepID=UPI002A6B4CA2|nr:hypothetical protein [Microbacterium sp. CFBP9034]MDY0907922.1 hypothetical protein [Microbacterium sp. CFBP9034]
MTAPSETGRVASSRRRGARIAVAALVVLVAASIALALVVLLPSAPDPSAQAPVATEAAEPPDDEPSTASLEFDAPAAVPLGPDEDAEVERAEETAVSAVAAINEMAQRADGSTVGLDQIATGFVLGELQSSARDRFDLGYRQIGEARVTQTTASAVDLEGDPPSMTLTVCVDVSDIDVLDQAGNSLKSSLYDPGRPVKHVYGAVFQDDVWKLATHEIPDDQDCALP